MAARCSMSNTVVVGAAGMMMMMMMMMIMSPAGVASSDGCPYGMVYPYWSTCESPANYEGVYELAAASGDAAAAGGLAPEWDETNSTYYVRLAEDGGAKYYFHYLTRELRSAVAQTDNVIIANVETGRSLGWRQEGDEYFLVEEEKGVTNFQFSKADDVVLPCPRVANARCEAYYILNFNTSLGLAPYVEDGATYFTLSHSSSALPFTLLISTTSSSLDIKMPSS